MIRLYYKFGDATAAAARWGPGTQRPQPHTIMETVNRMLDTGTVDDRFRQGRPSTYFELALEIVDKDVRTHPTSSQRNRAMRLGLSQSMVRQCLRN